MKKLFLASLIATCLAAYAAENISAQNLEPINLKEELEASLAEVRLDQVNIEELFSTQHLDTEYSPVKLEASFSEAVEITLDDILAKALENNLNYRIAQLRTEEARWKFWNSVGNLLPDLNLTAQSQKRNGTFYLNSNFQNNIDERISNAGFRLNYRAFDGGTRSFLAWSEKYYKEAVAAQERSEMNKTILNTVSFFLDMVENQVALAVQLKAFERSKANLDLVKKFVDAGKGTKYDEMQAESNLAKSQQSLIETEADYRIAQLNLAEHLNFPLETIMKIKENKLKTFAYINDDLDIKEFVSIALEQNPDIEMLLKNRKGAVKEGLSRVGDFLPKLDLYWDITGSGQEFTDLVKISTLGFQASYNIGNGMGMNAVSRAFESNATVDRARLEYEKEVLGIQKNLRTSFIGFQKSKALVYASNKQYLAAKEALQLSKLRYQNGIEIFTNLLEKEAELTQSELSLISAIADYNLSQAQIAYNMGTISASGILESRI